MRKIGATAYLSWEDVTEGLAGGHRLLIPRDAAHLSLDEEALEMMKLNFDLGEEA